MVWYIGILCGLPAVSNVFPFDDDGGKNLFNLHVLEWIYYGDNK